MISIRVKNLISVFIFILLTILHGCAGTPSSNNQPPATGQATQTIPVTPAVNTSGTVTPPVSQPPPQTTPGVTTPPQSSGPGPNDVLMKNDLFAPATLSVAVGTTVTWTNQDYDLHTVSSYDGLFESGPLDYHETFSFTFNKPGTYNYYCKPHPEMLGTIVVK
jgi:plastocyanin